MGCCGSFQSVPQITQVCRGAPRGFSRRLEPSLTVAYYRNGSSYRRYMAMLRVNYNAELARKA